MPINSFLYPAKNVPTVYEVANSCRFNDGDSPDMLKNLSSGSRTKWTFSTWFKRSALSSTQYLFRCIEDGNAGNYTYLQFNSSNQLIFLDYSSSDNAKLQTNRLFRDISAWYHVCLIIDTTDGTAGDRQKLYINGVRETSFASSANYSSSFDTNMNVADYKFNIAYDGDNSGSYFDGYLAETVFLDGTDEVIGSFGENDEDSPTIWKPKDVSGLTFGTNGFYLDYEDSSNLGNDANGGTDFTETNLAATDQATDTPTNNFATMNSLDNYYAGATFSEGNLKIVTGGSNITYVTSTIGFSSGKFYMETKLAGSAGYTIGVVKGVSEGNDNDNKLGNRGDGWSYDDGGDVENNGSTLSGSFDSYSSGDIIGVYADLDNNKLYFSKNGTLQNSGTGLALTSGTYFFAVGDNHASNSSTFEVNFGSPTFSISSGNTDGEYGNFEYSTTITGDSASKTFKVLNTKNLAEFG